MMMTRSLPRVEGWIESGAAELRRRGLVPGAAAGQQGSDVREVSRCGGAGRGTLGSPRNMRRLVTATTCQSDVNRCRRFVS